MITIPESTRAFIIIQKARISNETERMVIHKIEFKVAGCYEETCRSLQ